MQCGDEMSSPQARALLLTGLVPAKTSFQPQPDVEKEGRHNERSSEARLLAQHPGVAEPAILELALNLESQGRGVQMGAEAARMALGSRE